MVRLFNVYYPVRQLALMGGESLVVCVSFLTAAWFVLGPDCYIALNYEYGIWKILGVTAIAMLCSYYFDLYAPQMLESGGETYFRLLAVLSVLSFLLAATSYFYPALQIGQNVFLIGLMFLTFSLLIWRSAYFWLIGQPFMQEKVYVLGGGERATSLVEAIRSHKDWGMSVVGWAGALGGSTPTKDEYASILANLSKDKAVDKIIVALSDRRGTMPVRELLHIRLNGIPVEEANFILEKINGKIELDDLHPSAMIFSEGFRVKRGNLFLRRVMSFVISLIGLVLTVPIFPIVALLVKLTSPGPVFFSQERVGRKGRTFRVYKFRTMRQDAEAGGAKWAIKNDPRITPIGKFLRKTRLDEVPQLWNVLKGDMAFVGPRPERPEFVQWLAEAIPYYNLRHIIRPGLTGWAQVRYSYGASLEESKEKLKYDLYYIKHMSLSLDLLIMFETIKTVLLRKGSQ
jgi:sugar transferase (PEP-CTERM system associated)